MDDKEDNYTIRQQLVKRNIGLLELLAVAFVIFKTQFKTFFIITLLLGIPLNIIQILYPIPVIDIRNLDLIDPQELVSPALQLLLNVVFSSLQTAAVVLIVRKSILGRYVDASSSMLFAMKKLPKVLLTYAIFSILVVIGVMLFVIPGIIISILFILSIYVASARDEYGISAIKYTLHFIKKNALKMASTFIFITLFQLSFIVVFGGYVSAVEEYYAIYNVSYYLSMYLLSGYLTTVAASLFFHYEYNYGKRITMLK